MRRLWGTLRVPRAGRAEPAGGRETAFAKNCGRPRRIWQGAVRRGGPMQFLVPWMLQELCLTLLGEKPDTRYVAAARSLATTARIVRTLYADSALYIVISRFLQSLCGTSTGWTGARGRVVPRNNGSPAERDMEGPGESFGSRVDADQRERTGIAEALPLQPLLPCWQAHGRRHRGRRRRHSLGGRRGRCCMGWRSPTLSPLPFPRHSG